MAKETRPALGELKSSAELRRWYYLKTELSAFCKANGISRAGGKFELIDRIAEYLDTGQATAKHEAKPASRFNWAKADLSLNTVITDNVTFGKNVRTFLASQIGKQFVCNSDFMNWVKSNEGKTLKDAVAAWHRLEKRKLDPNFKRDIAPHNMLNQYTRDFFAGNPDKTRADMMRCWNLKKRLPNSGRVRYEPSDLLLEEPA